MSNIADFFIRIHAENVAKAELQAAKKDLDDLFTSTDNLEKKFTGLGDVAKIAGGIVLANLASSVSRELSSAFGETAAQAGNLELTLARITAASGLTAEGQLELSSQLKEAALNQASLGISANNAAQALEAIYKATGSADSAMQSLTPTLQLATVEGINTANAANLIVSAYTLFGLGAEGAQRAVDALMKASATGIGTASQYAQGLANVGGTASSMGLSIEDTMAALVILDSNFADAATSGTILNRTLLDVADKASAAGLNIYDASGQMASMDEIVAQLREKVQGFGTDQQALNEWLSQFDTRAQKGILALVNYNGSIESTKTSMEGMAGAQEQANVILDTNIGMQQKAQAQLDNTNAETGKLTVSLQTQWATFTAGLGPIGALTNAIGPSFLTGAVQGLAIVAIPQLIGALAAGTLGTTLMTTATGIWSGVSGIATAATTALGAAVSFLGWPIIIIIASITALILVLKYLYDNNETVRNAINGFAQFLSGAFASAIKVAGDVWNALASGIMWAYNTFIAPVIGLIQGFADAIAGIFQWLFGWLVGGSLWTDLCSGLGSIWNSIAGPLVGVAQTWANGFMTVFNGLKTGLTAIWNGITGAIQGAANTIGGIVNGVISAVNSAWSKVQTFVSNASAAVSSAVSSAQTALANIGSTIQSGVSNLISGATSLVSSAWNAITGVTTASSAPVVSNPLNPVNVTGSTSSYQPYGYGGAIFAQHGFHGVVSRPTLAVIGEGSRRERVDITPEGSEGFGSGGLVVHLNFPNVLTLPENPETIKRLIYPALRQFQLDVQRTR